MGKWNPECQLFLFFIILSFYFLSPQLYRIANSGLDKVFGVTVETTREKIYLFITGGIIQGVACIMIGSTVEIVDVAKLNISIFGA